MSIPNLFAYNIMHFDLINQCLTEFCAPVLFFNLLFFNLLFPCHKPISFFLTAKLPGLLLISETLQNNHLFKDFIVPQESKSRIFGCEGLLKV